MCQTIIRTDEKKFCSICIRLIIVLLFVLTFLPLLKIGFTVNDDLELFTIAQLKPDLVGKAVNGAISIGRFFYVISFFLRIAPYLIDNYFYLKVMGLGPVILNILLFSYTVRLYYKSSYLAVVISVLYLVFLANNWEYSPINSALFLFSMSFNLVLISFIFFHRYIESSKNIHRVTSAVFLFLAALTYEIFILYFVFYIAFLLLPPKNSRRKLLFRESVFERIRPILPHAFATGLYFFLYFAWRLFFPSGSESTQFGQISFNAVFSVVYQFSISSLPTYMYFMNKGYLEFFSFSFEGHSTGLWHILKNVQIEWIIKAVLGSFLVWFVLASKPLVFSHKKFVVTLIVAITFFFLPVIPLGFSEKYQEMVYYGAEAYLVTYFSFFGTILFIAAVLIYINQVLSKKKWASVSFAIIAGFGIGIATLFTEYNNHHVTQSQVLSHFKWKTVDQFLKTEEFGKVPEGSIIYAPSLWHSIGRASIHEVFWDDYIRIKTGRNVRIIKDRDRLLKKVDPNKVKDADFYFLKYSQESKDPNQFLVFSKPERLEILSEGLSFYSKKVTLFTYSKYKSFVFFFKTGEEIERQKIVVDKDHAVQVSQWMFSGLVNKRDQKVPFIKTEICGQDIRVESVSISFFTD